MNKTGFVAACVMAVLTCVMVNSHARAADGQKTLKPSQKTPLFKIRKPDHLSTHGTYYPLCKEVLKIVNLPENDDFRQKPMENDFSEGDAFYIPLDRFKNFSLPTWETIPKDQWTNYVEPDLITQWERPNGAIVQMRKTMVDIDHDGNKDEMIDFSSDVRANDPNFRNPERECVISKNAAPYMLDKAQGITAYNSYYMDSCFVFSYKGRAYMGMNYGAINIIEYGHIDTKWGRSVSQNYVCDIAQTD